MNALITFSFHSSTVRTLTRDNQIYFCLPDVCKILTLQNPAHAVAQIKEEFSIPTLNVGMVTRPDGSKVRATFITEPQLYFVMMRSRAKTAREFRQWICNEVLPQIRRTGAYSVPNTKGNNKYEWMKRDLQNIINVNDLTMNRILEVCDRAWRQGYAVASSVKEREALKTEPQALIDDNTDKVLVSKQTLKTCLSMLTAHSEQRKRFVKCAAEFGHIVDTINTLTPFLWLYSDFMGLSAPSALKELEQVKA